MCGISDFSLSIPSCYISIEDFAKQKNIEYPKLKFGLGLDKMSVLDADEDIITLAADALIDLLSKNPQINFTNLKRLYVGTESQIDGSKPVASYVLGISNQYFRSQGLPAIEECDVTDQVFACIGAVDALENCLLWLKQNPNDYAIVIATDKAKYNFNSTGEYTQGAGAVAMLLSSEPSLLAISIKEHHLDECTQVSHLDKLIRKTSEYQEFVNSQIADGEIASGQVGNIYSGSIFLSIMSMLYYSYQKEKQLSEHTIGLIAYGSGSKSKVLEATVKKGWQNIVSQFNLQEKLDNRMKISFETYKDHYFNKATKVSNPKEKNVLLNHIGIGESNYGARNYKYMK